MLNNIMTMNILHAAAKENVSYFGFIGSSTQYPEADYCISEAEINLRKPHEVYKRNGGFKRYHLELIQQLQEITDIKFGVVVPNAVYGPNDTFGEDGHVLPALIVKASQGMNPFEVWGDGNQVREFVHVDDLIDALFFVLENDPSASPYNACTGVATTINELVRLVTEQYGYEPTINHDLSKPVMLPKRRISVEKINKLGWKSSISLKEGLRQTIEWYEKNKDE
jgi:GDP-L-fucose synthase